MVMAASLVIGCAAASTALWYYSRRYVGELSLLPAKQKACFSVLDFWGNREVLSVHASQHDIHSQATQHKSKLPYVCTGSSKRLGGFAFAFCIRIVSF